MAETGVPPDSSAARAEGVPPDLRLLITVRLKENVKLPYRIGHDMPLFKLKEDFEKVWDNTIVRLLYGPHEVLEGQTPREASC